MTIDIALQERHARIERTMEIVLQERHARIEREVGHWNWRAFWLGFGLGLGLGYWLLFFAKDPRRRRPKAAEEKRQQGHFLLGFRDWFLSKRYIL